MDLIEPAQRPNKADLHSLKVQTADTIRYNYLIKANLEARIPVMLCGPTGTGKTSILKEYGEKLTAEGDFIFL